jgi:glycyl-tRNA synthetase alpha chain
VEWGPGITYGDVYLQNEKEFSQYNFETADVDALQTWFTMYEKEAGRVCEASLVLPAFDYVLKCSHCFNLLDARGAISVAERTTYIARVRNLARMCAQAYLEQREALGFPLLKLKEEQV